MGVMASTGVDAVRPHPDSAVAASSASADPGAGAPSTAQLKAMAEAKQRRKKIDRAATVAAIGGWVTAVLAALSAPFAVFHFESLLAGIVLGAVAYHEFKGRRMLMSLHPMAPRVLGVN